MSHPTSQKLEAIESHSQIARQFSLAYSQNDPFRNTFVYSRLRLEEWMDRMLPARGEGSRLADLGCGAGHYTALYHSRGYTVVGVDGSPEMLREASATAPGLNFLQGTLDHLPLPDSSCDYLICIEVLRYVNGIAPALSEMARVLKPGGICLATALPLFNANGYWAVNRIASTLQLTSLSSLKQYFVTGSEIRREFRRAGFSSAEVHGVYTGPINWVERLATSCLSAFLRRWVHVDRRIADWPLVRELSNMFLVRAVRGGSCPK